MTNDPGPWHPGFPCRRGSDRSPGSGGTSAIRPFDVQTDTREGLPAAAELEKASEELDLLVLDSRGYGPVNRVLLGSTSARLARNAACPLVVVPRSATATD